MLYIYSGHSVLHLVLLENSYISEMLPETLI